jgi:4-hydroxy-4-methyl-2-oxoglutarate aldolase
MADEPTVNPCADQIPADWLTVFQDIRTALLGHVTDDGFVDEKIRPVFPGVRVLGTAVTVRLEEGDLEPTVIAVDMLRKGDVLVIDHAGIESTACWGELTSMAALARGCAGVIVDGAITNVVEIQAHQIPTFARGIAALGGRRLMKGGGVNVPAQCGGVAVHPGDLIVADDDGIVVIPPPRLPDIAMAAKAAQERTPFARAWLQRGGPLGEIVGLDADEIQASLGQRGWL